MNIKLIPFLGLIFISISLYSQKTDLNIGETRTKNYYDEITFDFIKDKIFIPVEINNKTYRFILDTGAPNIISKNIFDLIEPHILKVIPITDASGKKDSLRMVSVKEITLGKITFENTATLVYDLDSSPVFKCLGIDGFIGSNMLRNSILQVDLNDKLIRLTNNRKNLNLIKSNSKKIKLSGVQSNPYVWIELQGQNRKKERVLIDTGMDGLFDLSYKTYQKLKREAIFNVTGKSNGASSISLFGDVPDKEHFRLQIPKLSINNFEVKNVITNTTNDNNSRIGAELLRYGRMTIDYKNKRFYFDPLADSIDLKEPLYGFSLTIKNEKLIIGFVWDDDLKDTISYGDEIIEIDRKIVSESKICTLIRQESVLKRADSLKLKIRSVKGVVSDYTFYKKLPHPVKPH